MTYTEALTELEKIVTILQSDNCDIDRMVELTRRATELLTFCRTRLTTTEEELRTVLSSLQDPQSSAPSSPA
ncbi:MAG: exodeoxyribonuclease VII small subunit [Muribaculaceae bacterium]|nr:exodeoxyribonuclease VII small subunit [Muribaculaceae bacterium]